MRTMANMVSCSTTSDRASTGSIPGRDNDNDQFICDAGEAGGAFRTLDLAEAIAVNGDRAALDFLSGFPTNLFGLGSIAATASAAPPRHAPVRRLER
jgi:hypothetical protein